MYVYLDRLVRTVQPRAVKWTENRAMKGTFQEKKYTNINIDTFTRPSSFKVSIKELVLW